MSEHDAFELAFELAFERTFERSDVKTGFAIMTGVAFVLFTLATALVIWLAGSSYFKTARERTEPHSVAKTAALFPVPRISEAKAVAIYPHLNGQLESQIQLPTDEHINKLLLFAAEHKLIRLHFAADAK